ncbi:P-loop NTPase fold protein [Aeromonas jandaei]|uniref:P-loop NTPase fold protein n=1 Tax=Aeromonas jandaei TaxID=650 RepID=UPI003BA3183B
MKKVNQQQDNWKFVVLRYASIMIYTFITCLFYYSIFNYTSFKDIIAWWRKFYYSVPDEITLIILLLSGALTKLILINCRDSTPSKPPHEATNVEPKIVSFPSFLNWIHVHLYNHLINPPLSASIFISICGWVFLNGHKILFDNFHPFLLSYFIGWTIPYVYAYKRKKIYKDFQGDPTSTIQDEKPLINKRNDTLNRRHIVKMISEIINTQGASDARGIAIIGPFGIGKSSLINMSINDVLEKNNKNIICRLDTWGTYESDEQIQRFIIDEIINSISTITSVTQLIGLPSKYINSLKGAQSFWLDTLPLLYNHASASSQLEKIGNLLSLMHYQMILVIEDIDRNSHANDILNGIAPLLDKLNHQSSIKLIISIGDKFNNPDILNRVCRYKEFLYYNHMETHANALMIIKNLSSSSNSTYRGDVEDFFFENDFEHTPVRNALFGYITSKRDYNFIFREVEFIWKKILAGQCDILDLLAITIIKNYEPNLIMAISEFNGDNKEDALKGHLSKYNLQNTKSATLIFKYFFIEKIFNSKRLQACGSYKNYYLTMLIERKTNFKKYKKPESVYFYYADKILSELDSITDTDRTEKINNYYKVMADIKSHEKIIYDLAALSNKGKTSLLMLSIIYWDIKNNSSKRYNVTTFSDALKNVDLFSVKNTPLSQSLTTSISKSLITHPISHQLSFYKAIKHAQNIELFSKPSIKDLYTAGKNEYERNNKQYIADLLYNLAALFSILFKDGELLLATEIINDNSDFKLKSCEYLIKSEGYINSQEYLSVLVKVRKHIITIEEKLVNN